MLLTENFLIVKVCLSVLTLHERALARLRVDSMLRTFGLSAGFDMDGPLRKHIAATILDLLSLLLHLCRDILLDELRLALKLRLLAVQVLLCMDSQVPALRIVKVLAERGRVLFKAVFTTGSCVDLCVLCVDMLLCVGSERWRLGIILIHFLIYSNRGSMNFN